MTKIVINQCHGGFGLSEEAVVRYNEIMGRTIYIIEDQFGWMKTYSLVPADQRVKDVSGTAWHDMSMEERGEHNRVYAEQTFLFRDLARDDPVLVQVVSELGDQANGKHAELKIVEIPADVDWTVEEYDGAEWVAERHRTWR